LPDQLYSAAHNSIAVLCYQRASYLYVQYDEDQIEALVNQLNQAANGLPQINTRSIYFQIEAALRSGKLDVVEELGFIKLIWVKYRN